MNGDEFMYKKKEIHEDRSTVKKSEYILDHMFFGTLLGYAFITWLPKICPIAYSYKSEVVLILCMIVMCSVGILLSYKNNRTNKETGRDIISGLGLYVLITLGKLCGILVIYIFLVLLTITLAEAVYCILLEHNNKKLNNYLNIEKIYNLILIIKNNFVLSCNLFLCILPIYLRITSESELLIPFYEIANEERRAICNDYVITEAYDDRYCLSENIETIKLIRNNDIFQELDYEKKCEVVEAIMQCEARYLGLCKIHLEFAEMEETILGKYISKTKTITINSKPLKDGTKIGGSNEAVLRTVLHECRHCYQELLVDLFKAATPEQRNLYAFTSEGVSLWLQNMNDYYTVSNESDSNGYLHYRNQALEEDARRWEDVEMIDYFNRIDELLDESNSNINE